MNEKLNYNEIVKFIKEFGVDLINQSGELIIDEPTNTYASIKHCEDIDDVKTAVIYALCRPIGKGLDDKTAQRLLDRVNNYFNTLLTKEDMLLIYQKLCYVREVQRFKDFIKRGFPMNELWEESE